jgi:ankyrin repeat protein
MELLLGGFEMSTKPPASEEAHRGWMEAIKLLIAQGAQLHFPRSNALVSLVRSGRGPRRGVREAVSLLVAADPSLLNAPASTGYTALIRATHYGDVDMVDALIRAGAAVDWRTGKGCTALMSAVEFAKYPQPYIVELLLRAKADPNLRDTAGDTALLHAIRASGRTKTPMTRITLQLLAEAGADMEAGRGEEDTSLMVAIEAPQVPETAVILLLDAIVMGRCR